VFPQTEYKAQIGYIRYDNQCNANIPGMHYDLGTKILRHGKTAPILGEFPPSQGVNGLILSDPYLVYLW
jgi:hypothetical protein